MKVAIFGAGTMGSGIAQVFAAKGHTALMYASSVASAQKHKDKLAASLAKRVAKGKMTQEAVDAAWAAIDDGSLKVFDTSKFTCQPAADGSYQVDADGHVTSAFGLDSDGDFVNDTGEAIVDGAFQESVLRSAPYFSLRIDGITELNNN